MSTSGSGKGVASEMFVLAPMLLVSCPEPSCAHVERRVECFFKHEIQMPPCDMKCYPKHQTLPLFVRVAL